MSRECGKDYADKMCSSNVGTYWGGGILGSWDILGSHIETEGYTETLHNRSRRIRSCGCLVGDEDNHGE